METIDKIKIVMDRLQELSKEKFKDIPADKWLTQITLYMDTGFDIEYSHRDMDKKNPKIVYAHTFLYYLKNEEEILGYELIKTTLKYTNIKKMPEPHDRFPPQGVKNWTVKETGEILKHEKLESKNIQSSLRT